MLVLKVIKWLLVAAVAGPVLSVVATCIVALLLVLVTVAWRSGNPPARMGAGQTMGGQVAALWDAPQGVGVESRLLIGH